MPRSIESQLNESYRDALVAYYLSAVVPKHKPLIALGLDTRLKTANDLYEFFLIDNQVSNDVQTSPVASAIASLQQYINGALMGMEPGYSDLRTDDAQFVEWRDRSSQYPIWAANQQLALYPEIYISPDLRLKKSTYFSRLENDINQNKISIDTTQDAVKHYLAGFEEVANLTIINGYIDSGDFAIGKYWFIGKSRAEDKYYWRTVDMNERAYVSGTEGPKYDYPTPGAWSDWTRADLGISANTLERTIRPVYFNNRLFVVWVDLIHVTQEMTVEMPTPTTQPPYPAPTNSASTGVVSTPNVQLLFNISYKKYDDSWSAPQIYMNVTRANALLAADTTLEESLNTIAVYDASNSPESLFIGMYAGEYLYQGDIDGSFSVYDFLQTAFIDPNFNYTPAFPSSGKVIQHVDITNLEPDEVRIRKACWVFALHDKNRFQFYWQTHVKVKSITTTSVESENPNWNQLDLQANIKNLEESAHSLSSEAGTLRITTDVSTAVSANEAMTVHLTFSAFEFDWEFFLSVRDASDLFLTLDQDSWGIGKPGGSYNLSMTYHESHLPPITYPNFLTSPDYGSISFETNERLSLAGFNVGFAAFTMMFNSPSMMESGRILSGTEHVYDAMKDLSITSNSAQYSFQQYFSYPSNMNQPQAAQTHLKGSLQNLPRIEPPSPFSVDIRFDRSTLLPVGFNTTFQEHSKAFYVAHGVGVNTVVPNERIGSAMKLSKIELEFASESGADPIAPKISKRTDPSLGIAEYIDFTGSSIEHTDGSDTAPRAPIRMNTLFARELINKANIALEALLSWGTQLLLEPPIGDQSESPRMDFKGANGLYFWELFLHLPFMIAHRLTLEKQFKESDLWLGFIFDPARKANADTGAPNYWNVRPLTEVSDPDYFLRAPIDPDGIAASDPVRYQKAVYSHYIKNLIERGDMAYRQLTPDSLNEAKLWYVRVLDLLGPRPDTRLISKWSPRTLATVADSKSTGLRQFEAQLIDQEQQMSASADENGGTSLISFKQAPLRLSTFGRDPTLMEEDNDNFIPPMNAELVKHWDTVESRLYNLRNNFTIDGKPLQLPLFAAPLDPRALLAAYANGGAGGGAGSLLTQDVPHFRYAVMASRASAAVETLIQFGNTLLSLIERKDQAEFTERQQQMAWDFAQFAIDLQLETQKVEVEARKALLASKAIADARETFYKNLASENVSIAEAAAMALQLEGRIYDGVASIAEGIGAMLKPVPGDMGLHVGATGGMAFGVAAGGEVGASK